MSKNIVLLSDGTGNTSAALLTTNVWRLYGALELSDPTRQVAYYDNGVGTSSFRPFAILGGIFGFGLKRNAIDIYKFLCRNYQPGDRIYGFGFSRGAFTIRVVMGLVARHGIVAYAESEAQLDRDAHDVYRANRARFKVKQPIQFLVVRPLRALRNGCAKLWRFICGNPVSGVQPTPIDAIHFVGLWDTVEAYGGPLEEITRGIDYWVWPLSMPDRYMSGKIQRACHALALDDERQAFWPMLWDDQSVGGDTDQLAISDTWRETVGKDGKRHVVVEQWKPLTTVVADIDKQRLSQVWFTGMHSDVGGGYAQAGLSYVTLDWMMDRAGAYGLLIKPAERTRLELFVNAYDKLNDSRHGLAGYYRYKPRKLVDVYAVDSEKPTFGRDIRRVFSAMGELAGRRRTAEPRRLPPMIHDSVFKRIKACADGYSPVVLPPDYCVTDKLGTVTSGRYEHATQSAQRGHEQEHAWNRVWGRRVVYFLTLFSSLFLASLPVTGSRLPDIGRYVPAEGLIPLVDAVGAVLPNMAKPWLDAFKQYPEYLAIGGVLVIIFLILGGNLQQSVWDRMRPIWIASMRNGPTPVGPSHEIDGVLYFVRTSKIYRGIFYTWRHWIGPFLAAVAIYAFLLYAFLFVTARVFFPIAVATGFVCTSGKPGTNEFDTRSLCHGTGFMVKKGSTYRITLDIPTTWEDGHRDRAPERQGIETGPNGFGWDLMTRRMIWGLPLRRFMSENWFATLVRVKPYGFDAQAVTFKADGNVRPRVHKAEFRARSSGEVFLYVNDSVLGLPRVADLFYRNNFGTAKVTFEQVP